jgi:outer membrane immunogenic protein
MKKLALAAVLTFAFAGAASAADLAARPYVKAPVAPIAVYNWTGFYIGGNAGYGWGNEDVSLAPTNNAASIAFFGASFPAFIPNTVSPEPEGWLAGGQIGYNWQAGRFVFGLEADLQGADISGTVNTAAAAPVGLIQSSTRQRLEWFGTVRGRAGFTLVDTLLLYGTGGFAYGSVNHRFFTTNNAGAFATTDVTNQRTGWTAGAGFEWGFAPNWSVKGEYLYIDLGSQTFATVPGGTTPVGASIDSTFRDKFHTARVGINYRFGGPVVAKY